MSEHHDALEHLKGNDPESIREAAFTAGQARLKEAVPLLAQHIQSNNLGVQEAADIAIRQIGGSAAIQAVVPLLRSDDAPIRNISMDILREIGSHDLPSLIALLHDEDADIRIFSSDILGTSDKLEAVTALGEALLRDPEVNVRYQAAVSLGALGFLEAAEFLNKAMEDEEWVQFAVIEALTKIGADSSVGALARALDASSDLVASMIVEAMGEMGNVKALPILLKKLETTSGPLRNKIVKAVVQLLGERSLSLLGDKERDNFRQYLLAALEDEDEDIQDAAMRGLSFVGGAKATAAVMSIAAKLDADQDHERLLQAVECLTSIGFNESLEDVIRNGEVYPVRIAVEAIGGMGSEEAVSLLMEVFWEKSRDEQRAIISVLSSSVDASASGFFLDVLDKHSDGNVLKAVLYYLGERAPDPANGERIFALLEHPYDDVKEAALEACIALGDSSMDQRFRQFSDSPDPIQRLMAIYALGKFGVEEHIGELSAALEDEVPDIRKVALEALFSVCPDTEERLELVRPRLSDENKEVRLALVELLGDCESVDALPLLVQALDDEDDWVIVRAVEAMGKRKEARAVEHLIPLLSSSSTLVLLKVIDALGEIGGGAAFRALLSIVEHEEPEVQQAAEAAVDRVRQDDEGV